MAGDGRRSRSAPRRPRAALLIAALALTHLPLAAAQDAEFIERFEGEQPSGRAQVADGTPARVAGQRRAAEAGTGGSRAEEVLFDVLRPGRGGDERVAWIEHELPPARVFDELTLTAQVQSNAPAADLMLRVIVPDAQDPATGRPLHAFVRGDGYTSEGKWQQLRCVTTDKLVQEQVHLLRNKYPDVRIGSANAYVDRAYLVVRLGPGRTGVRVDDLRLAPVVKPPAETVVQLTSFEAERASEPFPVEFDDRLLLQGRPYFPRLMTYHGEPADILKLAGANVVWVPDFEDEGLLASLQEHGLWATATPPRATAEDGAIVDTRDVSMIPFTEATRPILFWMLGTRVPPEARGDLISYIEQIRSADARFQRPLMVDVAGGEERAISRHVPMLGTSRHPLGTSFTLKQYRDWLVQRRNLAQQGNLLWTWIQTEPASEQAESREALGQAPAVIEPEQIRLQVYAALAAGCRGLGFWKRVPLDSDTPGALERRLMIAQLALELDLLAPWLVGGSVENQLPFSVEVRSAQGTTRRGLDFGSPQVQAEIFQLIQERESEQKRAARRPQELEAAIIRSDRGTLVLPIWYETDSQFVPGQMAASNAQIRIEGAPQTAKAWEVTTTSVRPLETTRVPGGLQVTLKRFDQTTAVVVSSDRAILGDLYAAIQQMAEPSAKIYTQLARAKLERVAAVDAQLRELGHNQPDSARILYVARDAADRAAQALDRGEWDEARTLSAAAMEALRILQRTHWDWAVAKLTSPVSSPHAINFQALPDHWRLIAQLGRSPMSGAPNLLRSGDFEDLDAMVVEGWQHVQNDVPGVQADVKLHPTSPHKGKYALRLAALPLAGQDAPLVVPNSPVIVTTPAVPVHGGQVVHISGWIRVSTPVTGSHDGVMLYDSLVGPAGALRWHGQCEWQQFSLVREIPRGGELSLTIALSGMGEVQFDDLQILPHNPRRSEQLASPQSPPAENRSALNLLDRIPGVRQLPTR